MLLYSRPILQDGCIYSIDNLRYSFSFSRTSGLDDMASFLQELKRLDGFSYYPSYKDYAFRHLFVFGFPRHSFSLGLSLNGDSKKDALAGFLDVNPNKIISNVVYDDGQLKPFSSELLKEFGFKRIYDSDGEEDDLIPAAFTPAPQDVYDITEGLYYKVTSLLNHYIADLEIRRWDLAVDVPYGRSEVQLLKDRRKYSQFYKSELDFTEYLGCQSAPGRVKIYNKQLEAQLNTPLTRIEVTLDSREYEQAVLSWPQVYLRTGYDLGNEKLVVQLLRALPTADMDFYFRKIKDRRTKTKYKELLLTHPFELDRLAFDKVVRILAETYAYFGIS